MMSFVRDLLPSCENCRRPSTFLFCESCLDQMCFRNGCAECGRILFVDLQTCLDCQSKQRPWKSLRHLFWYREGVRTWLLDIKENFRIERLAEVRKFLPRHCPERVDGICSVSSDPRLLRSRLFSVADEWARLLSQQWGIPFLGSPFRRHEFLVSQKELSLQDRQKYLSTMVQLSEAFQNRSFNSLLLVDDVMTSGASLSVHAERLRAIAREIHVYSLARVEMTRS